MTDECWPVHRRGIKIGKEATWPRIGTLVPKDAISKLLDSGYLAEDPTKPLLKTADTDDRMDHEDAWYSYQSVLPFNLERVYGIIPR